MTVPRNGTTDDTTAAAPDRDDDLTRPMPTPTSAPSAPARREPAPGEVEVECPGCGLLLVGDSPRPTAEWFCPRCDFPVFWASPAAPSSSPPQRRARRRLPGTAGREVVGGGPCWNCGEHNEPGQTPCLRCAATLPKPKEPQLEPVVDEAERLVPAPYTIPISTWPFVLAGTLGGASIAMAITLVLLGGGP
jgi:hypothetical protein